MVCTGWHSVEGRDESWPGWLRVSPLSRKNRAATTDRWRWRVYLTPLTAASTGRKQRRPGGSHGAWAHAPLGARRQCCRWALSEIETAGCRSCAAKTAKLTPMQGPEGDRTNHRGGCGWKKAGLSAQTHGDWTRCISRRRRRISRRKSVSRLVPPLPGRERSQHSIQPTWPSASHETVLQPPLMSLSRC